MDAEKARAENLRKLVRQYQTQAALARAIEANPSHISQIINGFRGMGTKFARNIERRLRLEPGSLDQAPEGGVGEYYGKRTPAERWVPLLNSAQARDFHTHVRRYLEGEKMQAIGLDVQLSGEAGLSAFAITVETDAMRDPDGGGINPGDTVVVDPDWPVAPGCYVLAFVAGNDSIVARQYRPLDITGNRWELIPLNPHHATVTMSHGTDGHIMGRIIEHRRTLV